MNLTELIGSMAPFEMATDEIVRSAIDAVQRGEGALFVLEAGEAVMEGTAVAIGGHIVLVSDESSSASAPWALDHLVVDDEANVGLTWTGAYEDWRRACNERESAGDEQLATLANSVDGCARLTLVRTPHRGEMLIAELWLGDPSYACLVDPVDYQTAVVLPISRTVLDEAILPMLEAESVPVTADANQPTAADEIGSLLVNWALSARTTDPLPPRTAVLELSNNPSTVQIVCSSTARDAPMRITIVNGVCLAAGVEVVDLPTAFMLADLIRFIRPAVQIDRLRPAQTPLTETVDEVRDVLELELAGTHNVLTTTRQSSEGTTSSSVAWSYDGEDLWLWEATPDYVQARPAEPADVLFSMVEVIGTVLFEV